MINTLQYFLLAIQNKSIYMSTTIEELIKGHEAQRHSVDFVRRAISNCGIKKLFSVSRGPSQKCLVVLPLNNITTCVQINT